MEQYRLSVVQAANQLRNLLPCEFEREIQFHDGLNSILARYIDIVSSIDEQQFNDFIKVCELNVELTHKKFINFVKRIVDAVKSIIETYLDGAPYEAYSQLDNLLSHNKVKKRGGANGNVSLSSYLDDSYGNFFSHDTTDWDKLYRIRIGKDVNADGMYHVPFTQRERVDTYRFSIPGWPAFYVGTSVEVCWQEVKREISDYENIYLARFKTKNKLILFSLQIPQEFFVSTDIVDCTLLYYFLSTFPVYAASLVKVRYPDRPFKPEYIFPQMLLQYVKSNSIYKYTGIVYSSTKCKANIENPNLDIVIPTDMSNGNICSKIKNNFLIIDFDKLSKSSDNDILKQLKEHA